MRMKGFPGSEGKMIEGTKVVDGKPSACYREAEDRVERLPFAR